MNTSLILAIFTILLWGVWGFFLKISQFKIGMQTFFWSSFVLFPVTVVYLWVSKEFLPLRWDTVGITWALIAGFAGSLGSVTFYLLLKYSKASLVIPLTALYPVVTVILAILVLKEKITVLQSAGIVCALIAGILLGF